MRKRYVPPFTVIATVEMRTPCDSQEEAEELVRQMDLASFDHVTIINNHGRKTDED